MEKITVDFEQSTTEITFKLKYFIDDFLVGWIIIGIFKDGTKQYTAILYKLYVKPEFRHMHIGTKLMTKLNLLLPILSKRFKLKAIYLYPESSDKTFSNDDLILFYEKFGYSTQLDSTYMVKNI